jgi:hypothetical protein
MQMYNTELYDNFLQGQSAQYSMSNMTKTLIVCGALLLNANGSFFPAPPRINLPVCRGGSDGYLINHLYPSDSPTWSDVTTAYASPKDTANYIPETLSVLSKLAFLEGDAEAEKEADQFFNQIQIKTKKIMIRRKA